MSGRTRGPRRKGAGTPFRQKKEGCPTLVAPAFGATGWGFLSWFSANFLWHPAGIGARHGTPPSSAKSRRKDGATVMNLFCRKGRASPRRSPSPLDLYLSWMSPRSPTRIPSPRIPREFRKGSNQCYFGGSETAIERHCHDANTASRSEVTNSCRFGKTMTLKKVPSRSSTSSNISLAVEFE